MSAEISGDASNLPVRALVRLNGVVLPGTLFIPDSDEQRAELFALEAISDLSASEFRVLDAVEPLALSDLCANLTLGIYQ